MWGGVAFIKGTCTPQTNVCGRQIDPSFHQKFRLWLPWCTMKKHHKVSKTKFEIFETFEFSLTFLFFFIFSLCTRFSCLMKPHGHRSSKELMGVPMVTMELHEKIFHGVW